METVLDLQGVFAARWIGCRVRLTAPLVLPLPDGGEKMLAAGTHGQVVGLSFSRDAPLVVAFPGVPYKVAPLVEQVTIVAE